MMSESFFAKNKMILISCLFLLFISSSTSALAEDYLGDISLFAGGTAPTGWMFCDGRILPINHNTALYSLLGNQYGGDGRTTFNLPDFRGRSAVGTGCAANSYCTNVGNSGGNESPVRVDGGAFIEIDEGVAVDAMPPFLGLNYIVCVDGLYPSRW